MVLTLRMFELAAGFSDKRIADRNATSHNTVKTQTRHVLSALGISCRHEIKDAVRAAERRAGDGANQDQLLQFLNLRFE